jgi:hypothetical protein
MNKKLKMYAVTLTVKPKPIIENVKYQRKTYRGCALAINANDAKQRSISIIIEGFSKQQNFIVTRDEIVIKECNLHEDFFTRTE